MTSYESLAVFVRERPFHYLWGLAADVAIVLYTFFFGPLAVAGALTTRRTQIVDWVGRTWCRLIVRTCGIAVDLHGLHHLKPGKSYVLISNHLSNFDIWCTLATLPGTLRFVAKKELLSVPFFGQALAVSDHIVIDRKNPDEAIRKINAAAARSEAGIRILFYAEGTRSPDGEVHPFKRGGVTLALRTGLPIVPLSISGTRKFLPKNCAVIRPSGRVRIVLDEPIETAGLSLEARDELNRRVRERVVRNYVRDY